MKNGLYLVRPEGRRRGTHPWGILVRLDFPGNRCRRPMVPRPLGVCVPVKLTYHSSVSLVYVVSDLSSLSQVGEEHNELRQSV